MKLYKYSQHSNYLLDSLVNETVWLAPPYSLNDCFEGFFNYEHSSYSVLKKIYDENPHLKENIDYNYSDIFDEYRDDEPFNNLVEGRFEVYRSLFGSTSLSEVNDCPLMWAHYAGQHTGACLEVEVNECLESLNPVNYTNLLPSVSAKDIIFSSKEIMIKLLTTKSLHWSYEKEWRIIVEGSSNWESGNSVKRPFDIKCVILGCRMDIEIQMQLIEILYGLGIPVKLSKLSTKKYALDIMELNSSISKDSLMRFKLGLTKAFQVTTPHSGEE